MKYLVTATAGPGFASPEEEIEILEDLVIPSFDQLIKYENEKKILAGGLPVGERAFVFIAEASSNEDLDAMLRKIPVWGILDWTVTPLQSVQGRAEIERNALKELKKKV